MLQQFRRELHFGKTGSGWQPSDQPHNFAMLQLTLNAMPLRSGDVRECFGHVLICHCVLLITGVCEQPDALTWTYSAIVGRYDPRRIYQEGPNECDVVLLKDKRTLWAVMRVDGGDGTPSHRTLPFLTSTSTDGGTTPVEHYTHHSVWVPTYCTK